MPRGKQFVGGADQYLGQFPGPELHVTDPHLKAYLAAGRTLSFDAGRGLKEIEALASEGSVLSMLFLADAIKTGSRYRMNLDKAAGWYRHAASLGSGRAMYGLGLVHLSRGEDTEAIQALEVGVERNCGAAMWVLGRMYREGRGTEPDLARAVSLWKRGRSVGHIWSSRDLSRLEIAGGLGPAARMKGCLAFLADLAALPLAMFGNETDRLMR